MMSDSKWTVVADSCRLSQARGLGKVVVRSTKGEQ